MSTHDDEVARKLYEVIKRIEEQERATEAWFDANGYQRVMVLRTRCGAERRRCVNEKPPQSVWQVPLPSKAKMSWVSMHEPLKPINFESRSFAFVHRKIIHDAKLVEYEFGELEL